MPLVKSRFSIALVVTSAFFVSSFAHAEILFKESFDDQADWHGGEEFHLGSSRLPSRGANIPSKWDFARIDPAWSPSKGHPDRHEALEILASNADKARGGSGKSMVGWRGAITPSWEFEPSVVTAGRFLKVRNIASPSYGETVTTTVTLNGEVHTYSLTTHEKGARPSPQSQTSSGLFHNITGCRPSEIYDSNVIPISQDTSVSVTQGDYISSTKSTGSMGAWNYWGSENLLLKRIGEQNEVYVEFYITFSPEMHASFLVDKLGTSKIFRIYSFTGDWNDPFEYFGGVSHPDLVWGMSGGMDYGVRNKVSILGVDGDIGAPNMPRSAVGTGDYSLSYKSDMRGMSPEGGDPQLVDKVNGGIIGPNMDGPALMRNVFGRPGEYTKVAFYVKMNSEKGAYDGVLSQWIDDTRILHQETINWVPSHKPGDKWNVIGLGGNDFFQKYPNYLRHEEWYAIDDIVVMDRLPENLGTSSPENDAAPNPPRNFIIN